jgi:hypothetical protein
MELGRGSKTSFSERKMLSADRLSSSKSQSLEINKQSRVKSSGDSSYRMRHGKN